ncbi:MFS transporter [Brevundimonas subvibrioides]|uniref:Major facilitator superfamily MFS_1 n=1 Tax=Brevundimonas subvibrioides (strain ATCC 15264 / DSM 4735 / LMG 14903 / NBRC 16000 / CB 81) TaxID=633149 RepID=D9QHA4_BRESC|nr:MFS transporter [Brevundimonas subvibrioides]ADL01070.1 major facilitator superfamily MFS_1 [Brevundimonas subvibrioides ATCC 15264]
MQTPPADHDAGPSIPVGPGFIALYMAAQVGAYIAFIPLLTLLLPLKAEAIDPAGRTLALSQIALWGAVTAGVAGVMAGIIGDRTRHWRGGRSIWMIAGLAGTVASYVLIHRAATQSSLMAAIVALQISLNFMLNPLAATLPERVPGRQKGLVAGFTGLAFPLSSLFGALVIGVWLTGETERLTAVVLVTVAMVVPFIVMTFRAGPRSTAKPRQRPSLAAFADRDFLIAFGSRLLVQTAVALNVLYLLFFLDQETGLDRALKGMRIEVAMAVLLGTSTSLSVLAGLMGGRVSDRIGRRKQLVFGGALLLAMGSLLMALVPNWPGPWVAQAILGVGVGLYGITDAVLVAEVLPDRTHAGRDMGLMNVAVTAAQIFAPLLGLLALAWFGDDLQSIYVTGAVLALLGGAAVMKIHRVR